MKQCASINYAILSDPRIIRLLNDKGASGLGVYIILLMEIECMGEGRMPKANYDAINSSYSYLRKNIGSQLIDYYHLFEVDGDNYVRVCALAPACVPAPLPACVPACAPASLPAHVPAQVVNLNYPENNNININNHYGSSFIDALECENGMYKDSVCMQSTYGDLLKKHWKEAVAQFRQHVIAYDKLNGITSLQEARRYFSSFTKLSVRSGAILRDYLASLEKPENNINQYSTPAPADAPERPSPDHQWSFATNSWVLVH